MIDFLSILKRLGEANVEFVLVGALSAAVQGAQVSTFDVDIVHSRSKANRERLSDALAEMGARYRSHPDIVPTADRLDGPGHQLLVTDFGPLDVLGEIEDGLSYEDLLGDSTPVSLGDHVVQTLSIAKYLALRRANPRPRDHARFPLIEAALYAAATEMTELSLMTIYVELIDGGGFRPVESVPVAEGCARLGPATDASEKWSFPPGTLVNYEARDVNGERHLVAVSQHVREGK